MSELQDFLDKNLIRINNDKDNNNDLKFQIGLIIKNKRLKRNMSQKNLSNVTGITQANISRIEKGKVNLTLSQLKRIAEAMNLKIIISMEE